MTIKDVQTFDLFGGGEGSFKELLISTTDASRTVHRLIWTGHQQYLYLSRLQKTKKYKERVCYLLMYLYL